MGAADVIPGVSGGTIAFIMAAITAFVSNAGALWGSDGADAGLFWQSAAVLAVFLVGAVTGILGFSKFLHCLLARWHKQTLIVLAGFIIGSLVKVWPWSNPEALSQVERTGGYQIGWAICFALIGFALVTSIEILGNVPQKVTRLCLPQKRR